jgi:transposase
MWRWQPVPGAHHMARQLAAFGHEVRLISPQFVKPFVKANKNDFIDTEAICEAASRPSMGFATPKTEEKQILSARHRVSESLVRDRVKTSNQIHDLIWPSRNIPIWLLQSYN